MRQLAEIMRSLHSWQPPAPVLARYAAAECAATETDPVAIAASTLTPLSASQLGQLGRLIDHARAATFTDQAVLDVIAGRLAEVAARITLRRDADVVLHGDCTPANVLVQDGGWWRCWILNGPGAAREISRRPCPPSRPGLTGRRCCPGWPSSTRNCSMCLTLNSGSGSTAPKE